MINDCSEECLAVEIKQYISMCKSAREEIDDILGVRSGAYYFAQIGVYNFHFENRIPRFPQSVEFQLPHKSSDFDEFLRSEDAVFLPDAKYFKNSDLFKNDEKEIGFNHFLRLDNGCYGYPEGIKPGEIFKLDEAARLAYYMFHMYKKIWDENKKSWIYIMTQ